MQAPFHTPHFPFGGAITLGGKVILNTECSSLSAEQNINSMVLGPATVDVVHIQKALWEFTKSA